MIIERSCDNWKFYDQTGEFWYDMAVSLKDVSFLKIADKLTKFYGNKGYDY